MEMRKAVLGPRGERSIRVRSFAEWCVRGLQDKDYLSEIIAIRNAVAAHVRYVNDPARVELVKDPERIVEEIEATGRAVGDCDDIATFIATLASQIGREAEFVTVGFNASQPGNYSHVFPRVKEPKSGVWIVCDTVAGTQEARMLARVTTFQIWRID